MKNKELQAQTPYPEPISPRGGGGKDLGLLPQKGQII